jgi:hypothetical protein
LLLSERTKEESRLSPASAEDYAPRQYSFRSSAVMTVKLLIIGGSVFALLWMLDSLLVP